MIGVLGFLLAAVVIAAFVWSSQRTYTMVDPFRLKAFNIAFALLALAMAVWGLVVALDDATMTRNLMLMSDVLLLVSTACMVIVVVRKFSTLFLTSLAGVVSGLVAYRAYSMPSTAYVSDGLLYFNLQGSSRLFIVGLFAFVWLPAAMIIAGQIANIRILANRRLVLQAYFILLVALLAMFSKARRSEAIIALFGAIVLVFVILLVFNLSLTKAQAAQTAKRSKGHAAEHTTAN